MAAKVKVSPVVAAGYAPLPQTAGEEKVVHAILPLDTVALEANDVLDMLILPEGCVPVDVFVHADDLDSGGPTLTVDAGIIGGIPGDTTVANRTPLGIEFGDNLTLGQALGVARLALATGSRIVSQPVARSLGFKVQAAPTTPVVETGTFTVNRGVWKPGTVYTANDYLILPNGVKMQCTTGGTSGTYSGSESRAPSQAQPNWAIGYGLTTTDGGVTWTCRSPIIGMIVRYTMARAGLPL